jgi:hypothetical protein
MWNIEMTKASKKAEVKSDFENLVRNGIDFLQKAMSQLDEDPKHSVINFYTAVEIFLKAPLVLEHWTLVVVDRDFSRQRYEAGDFISVTFEDACSRLGNSLNRPLTKGAKDAFDRVRRHRNRMVHFYHSGISGKQREAIKLEQAQAWFELNRFITDTWHDEFHSFTQEFKRMERSLIANNHYARAKYENLATKIDGMKKAGTVFAECPYCKTAGLQVDEVVENLTSYHCIVCFQRDVRLKVTCPECGDQDQYVVADDGFTCGECDHSISSEGVYDLLDDSKKRYTKDYFDASTPANCGECQGHHTVCEYGDGYLCTSCLAYTDSVGHCEWCNDSMTGSTEDTYVTGCEFCDGYAGHHAND